MMRITFLLCLSVLFVQTGFAQIKIGMKVAPQITWASTDNKNTSSNGTRINVGYGLIVDYFFTENYAIGTEVCINSYGVNLNLNSAKYQSIDYNGANYMNTSPVNYDYKLSYFQVPVLIKMRTNEERGLRYYAEFGFGFGFLSKSKADVSFSDNAVQLSNVDVNSPDPSDNFSIRYSSGNTIRTYDDDVSSIRTSLIIGAGIHYHFHGSSAIIAGLRYDNGLNNYLVSDTWKTSLSYLGLNVGLLF